jgi:Cu-processing system ATP-binding protein
VISIRGLHKRFKKLEVLKGIDLEIEAGKVNAIVGPNASGKTTLIKSILGLVKPDNGEIFVKSQKLNGIWDYKKDIGYMPQIARFPENLTADEVIRLVRGLRDDSAKLDFELIVSFKLRKEMNKPLRTLSGGTRQKVSAVIAFLFYPDILILDEPTAGLDPISSSILKDKILKEKASGKTVILTSHIMSEIEELSDYIVFLVEGKIYFKGSLDHFRENTKESKLERAIARMMQGVDS